MRKTKNAGFTPYIEEPAKIAMILFVAVLVISVVTNIVLNGIPNS